LKFAEFVQYVVWNYKHSILASSLWRSQYDICQPCHIHYDAIGFYRTLRDDAKYILEKIAAGQDAYLVPRSMDTLQRSSNEYLTIYDTVPLGDIVSLLDMYKRDYEVFGYQIPEQIRRRLYNSSTSEA